MPVYFTDKPPELQYQTVKMRNGNRFEEFVEVYHVLPGTRQLVPSKELCRIRPGPGPSIRRLGTMAYLALLPPRQEYHCSVMQCAAQGGLFIFQLITYIYMFLFAWTLTIKFLEWGQ